MRVNLTKYNRANEVCVKDCNGKPGMQRSEMRTCSVKPDPKGNALNLIADYISTQGLLRTSQ